MIPILSALAKTVLKGGVKKALGSAVSSAAKSSVKDVASNAVKKAIPSKQLSIGDLADGNKNTYVGSAPKKLASIGKGALKGASDNMGSQEVNWSKRSEIINPSVDVHPSGDDAYQEQVNKLKNM